MMFVNIVICTSDNVSINPSSLFEQMFNNLSDKVYSVDSLVGINFSLLIRVVFYRFPYHSHYKSGPGFEFP